MRRLLLDELRNNDAPLGQIPILEIVGPTSAEYDIIMQGNRSGKDSTCFDADFDRSLGLVNDSLQILTRFNRDGIDR